MIRKLLLAGGFAASLALAAPYLSTAQTELVSKLKVVSCNSDGSYSCGFECCSSGVCMYCCN